MALLLLCLKYVGKKVRLEVLLSVCFSLSGVGGVYRKLKKKKVNHFIELTHKCTERIRMILLSEASPIFTCSTLGGRCVACVRLCVSALL